MSNDDSTLASSSKKETILDQSECEDKENDVCSLQELIDSEKKQSETANAVLGASDENNCSYDHGYVYRQALYSCLTCLKAQKIENNLHGFCLACSYECHQNHDLIELYTKRNFRCDCGNSKLSTNPCKLQPNKDVTNALNKYNQNFRGLYCVCNKSYPEADLNNSDPVNEDMMQCTICEDWFHLNHLVGSEKFRTNEEDFDEMICQLCMKNNQFLWYYQGYIAYVNDSKASTSEGGEKEVDVLTVNENELNKEQNILDTNASTTSCECFLEKMKAKYYKDLNVEEINSACYFLNDWRDALCKCESCLRMYKTHQVEYLINKNDTIKFYEDSGKSAANQIDENKLIDDELSKLSRISQLDLLRNLNDFKDQLKDFLADFAKNGQVVKRENIEEFFDELNERKRRKVSDENQHLGNYYCK
jgi:E3 ubiquitin-protein ligase UBR7